MEKIKKRMFLWLAVISLAFIAGYLLDAAYPYEFPIYLRILGLLGMIVAAMLLRISGRMLKTFGEPKEWGWTTKLVTHGVYSCVRHPHHFGIGLFVTSLGLLIGGYFTFLLLTVTIWITVIVFLLRVEEVELKEKFGSQYDEYSRKVPMIVPKPICLIRELIHPSIR